MGAGQGTFGDLATTTVTEVVPEVPRRSAVAVWQIIDGQAMMFPINNIDFN